jgi:hypothetical protein
MTTQAASHDLHREIEAARVLLATYPDIFGDDPEAAHDAVEGETDLHEAIHRGVVRIAEIDAALAGIKDLADKLKRRNDRLAQQKELLRTAIASAMELGGLRSMETDVATLSRKSTPQQLLVTDESLIPSKFFVRSDPRLDRKSLLDALKELGKDEAIPGAALSNGGTALQIRWS